MFSSFSYLYLCLIFIPNTSFHISLNKNFVFHNFHKCISLFSKFYLPILSIVFANFHNCSCSFSQLYVCFISIPNTSFHISLRVPSIKKNFVFTYFIIVFHNFQNYISSYSQSYFLIFTIVFLLNLDSKYLFPHFSENGFNQNILPADFAFSPRELISASFQN